MAGVGDWTWRADQDTPPARAAVVPRVHVASGSGAALSLESVVRRLIDSHTCGQILLLGRAGGGKTTALKHLRSVLPADAPVILYDEPPQIPIPRANTLDIVAHRDEPPGGQWFIKLELAPWEQDDCIEYCVARRRDQCSAVLARLKGDPGKSLLKGSPQLWRIVLDRLSADETVPDSIAALREHVDGVLPSGARRDAVARRCAEALMDPVKPLRVSELPADLPPYVTVLLRHRAVRVILASDLIAASIAAGGATADDLLCAPLPAELLHETASVVRWMPGAMERLDRMLAGSARDTDAMAASILLAADPLWRPKDARGAKFAKAVLPNAKWAGADMRGAELILANLREADLSGANLKSARAAGADFRGARFVGATMRRLSADGADFSTADLTRACAHAANLAGADFTSADLREADLSMGIFVQANLRGAQLIGTNLSQANLSRANVEEAELIGVKLDGAQLEHVILSAAANVSGVSFQRTTLHHCGLEGMRLPGADFSRADLTGSYLTGSFIPHGDFRGAILRETGLAEIDWEGADLRDADLRGCSFHMGSTRSGLVGSTTPCEGSRTGFYTDDFADRDFKAPEEIRKANLCAADLRGAIIDGVDFYLVDLRRAKYSPKQREQLARCGAILECND
jgi:uncharacterized protein YjbI with pentapeptide repeats